MPQFKIIRASAGSGKTFNLTGEYLRLLFAGHDNFRHILAVTFTNKATEEMKTRIINELHVLSSGLPSNQLPGLLVTTGLNEKQIRNRAGIILKRILHKYSYFSVSTIDSFFQHIIRNFTRELGIQSGYSIELDTDQVLSDTIDRLLIRAGSDKTLLLWLSMFAESLIEKGDNWNFRKSIRNLGSEIFKEEFKCIDNESIRLYANRDFLLKYRTELHSLCRTIETTYQSFGQKAVDILNIRNLTVDDFSGKSRGPAGFLVKLIKEPFREPTATAIHAATQIDKWHTANSVRKDELICAATEELMPLMQQTIDFYQDNHRHYFSASVILKNLFSLGILTDLSQLIDEWCNTNNAFLLPEAPVFLNKIIDGNDTPFIYEKTGCWFHHFMIDEFQDTSSMQWLNFKPLISNSLSQDFNNLAVGDAKQSIYRWRNSNWEILENQINRDFLPGILDQVILKKNWRSRPELITFNNHFFSKASGILQNEFNQLLTQNGHTNQTPDYQAIGNLYRDLEQIPGNQSLKGGYVKVEYIRDEDVLSFTDEVNRKVVELIARLQDQGYRLSDIAILTRRKSEARQLADYILNYANTHQHDGHRFDVISDEALRLGSSVTVNFTVSLLQFIIDPSDRTNQYYLVSMYHNYLNTIGVPEQWITPDEDGSRVDLPDEFFKLVDSAELYSLSELVERIIKIFHLERIAGELVYLQSLRDMIIEYSQRFGGDISRFMEFWNETGKERSVAAPSGQDSVRILTLHKSKGLEFKITIIPYCFWELNSYGRTILWCKPEEEPFSKLKTLPLVFTTQLQQTIFAQDHYNELYKQLIDNLNLLYVAFTRAQDALFVFCKEGKDDKLKNVSDLLRRVLGDSSYSAGSLESCDTIRRQEPTRFPVYEPVSLTAVTNRVRIAYQGVLLIDPEVSKPLRPLNEGRILHEVFQLIGSRNDISPAITRLQLNGKIAAEEKEKYNRMIEEAIQDDQVSWWFTPDWNVLTEPEIILPGGQVKRPDRVMIRNNQTLVIDYKFGATIESTHEKQISGYARLLKEMGYKNVEAYLWYVKLGKVVSCEL